MFLRWGVVSTSPNHQDGGPPYVGCSRLFIQYIRSYSPYWRPSLYLQPEDAPCRGDRDNIKMDLQEVELGHGLYGAGSGKEQVAGTCECGNEPLGSINCGEFLD